MKRALCIWLPHWPLQRLAAARVELRSRAVLLYQLHATRGARVVAYAPHLASAAATLWAPGGTGVSPGSASPRSTSTGGQAARGTHVKQHRQDASGTQKVTAPRVAGIRPDMPLAEATALAGYAGIVEPHLELHDPLADRAALEALAGWCGRFAPSVGVEEDPQPESLLLDVNGLDRLCGGERALAERVVREFRERRLTVRVAIADTLAAAWAVAHFADLQVADVPDATGGATDVSPVPEMKQQGQHWQDASGTRTARATGANILAALGIPLVVPPGETWTALAPLCVAALRLPEETCALLNDLGLRRIEQLAALARSTLLARFGPVLLERLDRATGAAPEAIVARTPQPEYEFQWLFEHPTARREMLELALMQLTAQACGALAERRRGVLRLQCRFESEGRSAEQFVVGLYRPSAQPRHVGELVRLKLESMRLVEPVVEIGLRVLAADRLEYRQQEIFVDPHACREAPRELAALVDRLSNRLGSRAVLRPWLLAGAQPEFACQYRPLASGRGQGSGARGRGDTGVSPVSGKTKRQRSNNSLQPLAADRPLSLQPRPLRLPVMSIAPEGPPVQFRLGQHDHRIVRVWGPERIETGWWRGRSVRRDYYQVETGGGERFWLFRELNSGEWFLHGEFA